MSDIRQVLDELREMDKPSLTKRWESVMRTPPPRISENFLRLALAHAVQTRAFGGLKRTARQRLDQLAAAKTATRDIQPGMRLAREFAGKVHVVIIGENREIIWNDRQWNSLSEVARTITGTRWSGPAFFGLRKARASA